MTHPIDIFIGTRVRAIRRELGISQKELGNAVGVRFQQIQKYETGDNRISASKLWEISKVLNVDIAQLFEGADETSHETKADATKLAEGTKELKKIVALFWKTPAPQREKVRDFLHNFAE